MMQLAEPVSIFKNKPPVVYDVTLIQHFDDTLQVSVHGVADDDRSRESIADALRRAADAIMEGR